MKKSVNIAYGLFIAIWPVVFIIGMDYFESHINEIISRTYNVWYIMFLLVIYAISGLIFAAIGYYQRENLKRTERVSALPEP